MAGGVNRKISAASARAHTRKAKRSSSPISSGLIRNIVVLLFFGFLAWGYQAIQPPAPKICGSPNGPLITAPRIKLRDGRYLAYKEHGVPKDSAKYKIIFVHSFASCRHNAIVANTISPDIIENLGVYILSFDRSGYGESDPNPKRTAKTIAFDIEELADQLGLGSKFYVIGFSMGGQAVWSCLKYIPNRLAGAALLAPVINYWWPGLPANVTNGAFYQQFQRDQWAVRVAHYTPWLTYWWNTQRWFPSSSVIATSPDNLSRQDKELQSKQVGTKECEAIFSQQGEHESIHRDMNVGFGKWEFSPVDLENPFPENEGSVHLWHGDEDRLVPVTLQRYIAKQLPWIHYHEVEGGGHRFPYADGISESIIKALLLNQK
ncbi:uncharacterized protein LOC111014284 [Momordica charantia]|uniref:Uncharacterized protein LOC111014284 n=1 Tax=Momordica charantia TaxID=3673 RepID=A0A6J1CU12_MOMCH|nr:uncharacterized protein LOC111014284 [Momordica charantia]